MIVRMNAPSRASILAKQKDGILLVHQVGVKSFSRTSPKVSIDLANETENRLLKSGKDTQIVYSTISSPTFSKTSSTFIPRNYLREAIYVVAKIVSSYPPNIISETRLKAE